VNTPRRIQFEGSEGRTLSALLDLPDGQPRAYVLFAHCFTCSKDFKAAYWIGQTLAEHGLAMLRFDFAGIGQSEGELGETSFSANIDDVLAAAAYLREHHRPAEILVGHSLGGTAILATASRIPEARAIATIGSPLEPAHLRQKLQPVAGSDLVEVEIAGKRVQVGRSFYEDLKSHDLEPVVAGLKKPLMVMHSPVDRVVGVEQAARIFQAAKHPKSFVSLDDADHLLLRHKNAEFAGHMLAAWASHYVAEHG
jgi:pimeloyl-ACP methyl ester carboxylesterase